MIVKFQAYYNGELWCAEAEQEDIFAIGGTLEELMTNVDLAARVHYSGRLAREEGLHIMVTNDVGAGG
ncbi:MAG: type II toxin-antitoxin system HicB family antitoxin [Candidatus Coatesbacteria bacterium]|nr:MAG: type II toxin-antitoxin system HicB family antitoxin [Candidatus Coatesbacteria bacterium]